MWAFWHQKQIPMLLTNWEPWHPMLLTTMLRTHTKELESERGKSQKKVPCSHENAMFLHTFKRIVFWRADFPTNLTKVLKVLMPMNKLLILIFWLSYLFNKATSICNKTGGTFSSMPRKWKLSLILVTSWL